MENAVIKFDHQYVDGGCNACGVLRCETYNMDYLNKEVGFSFLDIESLIQTIAQVNQWRQDYQEVGIGEEIDGLTKAGTFVEVEKLGRQMRYKNQATNQMLVVDNQYDSNEKLFSTINQILQTIFAIDEIHFSLVEIDK